MGIVSVLMRSHGLAVSVKAALWVVVKAAVPTGEVDGFQEGDLSKRRFKIFLKSGSLL